LPKAAVARLATCRINDASIVPVAWPRLPPGDRFFTGDDGFDAEVAILNGPRTLRSRLDAQTRATVRELVIDKGIFFQNGGVFLSRPPEPPDTNETLGWRAAAVAKRLTAASKEAAAGLEDLFWHDPNDGVRRRCFETLLWQMGDNVYSPEFSTTFSGDLSTHAEARLIDMLEVLKRSPEHQAAPVLARLLDNLSLPRPLVIPALVRLLACDKQGRWMRHLPRGHLPSALLKAVGARLAKEPSELVAGVAESVLMQAPDTIEAKVQLVLVRGVASAPTSEPELAARRRTLLHHFLSSREVPTVMTCVDGLLSDVSGMPALMGARVRSLPAPVLDRISSDPDTYLPALAQGLVIGLILLDDACAKTPDAPPHLARATRIYEVLSRSFGEELRTAMSRRLAAIDDDTERKLIEVLGRSAGPEALAWLTPLTSGLFRSSAVKRLAREAVAAIRERHGIGAKEARADDLRGAIAVVSDVDPEGHGGALSLVNEPTDRPKGGASKPSRKKR